MNQDLETTMNELLITETKLNQCDKERKELKNLRAIEEEKYRTIFVSKDESIKDLRDQLTDLKSQRDRQYSQVGDLTILSKSANDNMNQTLSQMESKDKYIRYLMNAKSKTDSLNLALAMNLKGVLKKGIEDEDIEVKVDKTVVFINLSDKMLFQSGSSSLSVRANEVLAKIAQIVQSRPELDLMVEGYTDNVPVKSSCLDDNWDLSVKRSVQVVRTLQNNYGVNPDKLIAAGRGQYNTLSDNNTSEGRSMNRRTRIILLPKLNQFYDILKPQDIN